MPWYRYIVILILVFTTSCYGQKNINRDFIYMIAVDCELHKKYRCSALNYSKLYDIDKNEIFLKRSISYALMVKEYKLIEKYIDIIKQKAKSSVAFARFLIPYYVENKNYKKAREIAELNLLKENTLQNQKIALAIQSDLTSLSSLKILKQLYLSTKDKIYAQLIINIYIKNKDEKNLIEFLEKYHIYDELLMDLYGNFKMYKKAENLAIKLYQKDKNPIFLIKAAVYLYEPNESAFSSNKKLKELEKVFDRFEKSVYKIMSPVYYNYYGYILIQHNKDIKKGLKLVNMALKIDPKNAYYIDSLAWGYYKSAECKKAFDVLSPLKDERQEDIQQHLKMIKKCLENKER
ncbi:MAG TPA: hypothetical protein EYG69_01550 [Campylobacterales bacterium]|nr:hypothetical protein [Campylobacterales bacterium]